MIVAHVFTQHAAEMPLVQKDHVVQEISSHGLNPPLSNPVLPRTSVRGPNNTYAHALERLDHVVAELAVAIADQIPRDIVIGERFAQSLANPRSRWIGSDPDMNDSAAGMMDDEQNRQHLESDRRFGREVHGRQAFSVIAKDGHPTLMGTGIARALGHVSSTVRSDTSRRASEAHHGSVVLPKLEYVKFHILQVMLGGRI